MLRFITEGYLECLETWTWWRQHHRTNLVAHFSASFVGLLWCGKSCKPKNKASLWVYEIGYAPSNGFIGFTTLVGQWVLKGNPFREPHASNSWDFPVIFPLDQVIKRIFLASNGRPTRGTSNLGKAIGSTIPLKCNYTCYGWDSNHQ